METGKTVWSWETRVANYSPLLATGSDLLFYGGLDHYLRAFDADAGQVIWQTRLPSQTVGGAITYSINGRQYIAIAAGGGAVGWNSGQPDARSRHVGRQQRDLNFAFEIGHSFFEVWNLVISDRGDFNVA